MQKNNLAQIEFLSLKLIKNYYHHEDVCVYVEKRLKKYARHESEKKKLHTDVRE